MRFCASDLDIQVSNLLKPRSKACGLRNFGTTCYLNAVLQCLKCIPELRSALRRYAKQHNPDTDNDLLTITLHALFKDLDTSNVPVSPTALFHVLQSIYPIFVEGQQDAAEAMQNIFESLSETLITSISNVVTELFSIEQGRGGMTRKDFFLTCYVNSTVNTLIDGINELNLESPVAESFTRLPKYLWVQVMRYDIKGGVKLAKRVEIPGELLIHGIRYQLHCVISHQGETTKTGHYVAWVMTDQGWTQIDDENGFLEREGMRVLYEGETTQPMAYLCLYRARGYHIPRERLRVIPRPSFSSPSEEPGTVKEEAVRESRKIFDFLNFCVLGTIAYQTSLGSSIDEKWIESNVHAYRTQIVLLGIGFASAVAVAWHTKFRPEKAPPSILGLISGGTTYMSVVILASWRLVPPAWGNWVKVGVVVVVGSLPWIVYWWWTPILSWIGKVWPEKAKEKVKEPAAVGKSGVVVGRFLLPRRIVYRMWTPLLSWIGKRWPGKEKVQEVKESRVEVRIDE